MVSTSEFDKNIIKLQETFGEKAFSSGRVEIIWDAVKDLNDDWFNKQVKKFLSMSKNSPLPEDFIDAAAKERNPKQELIKSECHICDTYGAVLRDDANGIMYAWRCVSCEAGKNYGGLPRWHMKYEPHYKKRKHPMPFSEGY